MLAITTAKVVTLICLLLIGACFLDAFFTVFTLQKSADLAVQRARAQALVLTAASTLACVAGCVFVVLSGPYPWLGEDTTSDQGAVVECCTAC